MGLENSQHLFLSVASCSMKRESYNISSDKSDVIMLHINEIGCSINRKTQF